ncbi:MAG: AtpZ/AtpI family protein [Pseudomonadota bacterium]
MAHDPDRAKLEGLAERIEAAQAARTPAPRVDSKYEGANLAWRMVIELVVGLFIGFGIGYGLDVLLGTLPLFLLLFTLLGFAAGVKTMITSAKEAERLGKSRATPGEGD